MEQNGVSVCIDNSLCQEGKLGPPQSPPQSLDRNSLDSDRISLLADLLIGLPENDRLAIISSLAYEERISIAKLLIGYKIQK